MIRGEHDGEGIFQFWDMRCTFELRAPYLLQKKPNIIFLYVLVDTGLAQTRHPNYLN